jgi:hypothetical protein
MRCILVLDLEQVRRILLRLSRSASPSGPSRAILTEPIPPLLPITEVTGACPGIALYLLPGSERTGLGGGRHREPDFDPFGSRGQRFASHQFDRWPVLIEQAPGIVEIVRPYSNAASLSAGAICYLKVKIEADCFQIFSDVLIISTHLVSPRFA